MSYSGHEIGNVLPAQAQVATVGKRRDEFPVSIEQPPRVDRREVGHPPLAIETHGVTSGVSCADERLSSPGAER